MVNETHYDFPYYEDEFVKVLKLKFLSPYTIKNYRNHLKVFSDFIYHEHKGNILLKDLKTSDFRSYLLFLKEEKNLTDNTVHNYITTVKSFYKFLVTDMGFPDKFAAKIEYRRKFNFTPSPVILTEPEIVRLLQSSKEDSSYFYVLIKLLYLTGMHISPALNLRKEDVNLKDGTIYLRSTNGHRNSHLPIIKSLAPNLEQFLKAHPVPSSPYLFPSLRNSKVPINDETVRNRLKRIKEKAGITKNVTPRTLRSTMILHHYDKGADVFLLSRILGVTTARPIIHLVQYNTSKKLDNLAEHSYFSNLP